MPAAAGGCSTAPFNSSCCVWSRAGGTTALLEYQGRRPSPTEGRRPTPDSVWVPLQRRRRRRCRQALSQQQDGVPPPRSRGVGARIIRRRKSLTPICHCSRDRSISLTPITNPSEFLRPATSVPSQIYPMRLRISSWLWFRGLSVAGRLQGFVCLNLDSVQCQPAMKILQSLHIDKDARALLDSAHRIVPSMAIRLGYFIV